jgi:hypothetical protein
MDAATGLAANKVISHAAWVTILRQADDAVSADVDAGFTTLVGFSLLDGRVYGASNGDSAVLAVHADGHTEELTNGQAKNPPIGSGSALCVLFATRLVRPWLVLAMSDGIWKYLGWDKVKEATTQQRGQALVDSLQSQGRLSRSGEFQDDFTLVVLQDRTG